jgi:hypothetical protein
LFTWLSVESEPWHEPPHEQQDSNLHGVFDSLDKAKAAATTYLEECGYLDDGTDLVFVEDEPGTLMILPDDDLDGIPVGIIVESELNVDRWADDPNDQDEEF